MAATQFFACRRFTALISYDLYKLIQYTTNQTSIYYTEVIGTIHHHSTVHSLQRNAEHLLAFMSPNIILAWDGAVITVDAVSSVVPEEECKHTRSSSKNSQLRVFLECPNKPSLLCLQFQTDGNPAICPASISLSGLLRGHSEAERVGGVF